MSFPRFPAAEASAGVRCSRRKAPRLEGDRGAPGTSPWQRPHGSPSPPSLSEEACVVPEGTGPTGGVECGDSWPSASRGAGRCHGTGPGHLSSNGGTSTPERECRPPPGRRSPFCGHGRPGEPGNSRFSGALTLPRAAGSRDGPSPGASVPGRPSTSCLGLQAPCPGVPGGCPLVLSWSRQGSASSRPRMYMWWSHCTWRPGRGCDLSHLLTQVEQGLGAFPACRTGPWSLNGDQRRPEVTHRPDSPLRAQRLDLLNERHGGTQPTSKLGPSAPNVRRAQPSRPARLRGCRRSAA